MTDGTIAHHVNIALTLVLLLSVPPLVLAAVVGLVVGLAQAVTQIQDQTLPMAVKIVVVFTALIFFGPLLAEPLVEHTHQLFDEFPLLTR